MTPTWVVGAGGLLGSAVVRRLAATGGTAWVGPRVPWGTDEAPEVLRDAAHRLSAEHPRWQVAWCAGAGVTGTSAAALAHEALAFQGALDGLSGDGALLLASSAGGVYAGSSAAPFDEHSPVAALSPYGESKLALEQRARDWAEDSGCSLVLARIANLYGPGQDVRKPQGLVSQLCRAHLLRQPVSVYVSLDTTRDYLYVDDAARLVLACLERAQGTHVKVLASHQAVTVGALLAELRRVSRRAPRVVLSSSPLSSLQARDLRLRSRVWTDLDRVPVTPLPVGVRRTLDDLAGQLRAGRLA